MKRDFVLLSVKWTRDRLMFWGRKSEESQPRSYGGYTEDVELCERYTFEEARSERIDFHEYEGESIARLKQINPDGTWIIRIDELEKLGSKTTSYRL